VVALGLVHAGCDEKKEHRAKISARSASAEPTPNVVEPEPLPVEDAGASTDFVGIPPVPPYDPAEYPPLKATAPRVKRLLGIWQFKSFDTDDIRVKERFARIPPELQKKMTAAASRSTLEITPEAFISKYADGQVRSRPWKIVGEEEEDVLVRTPYGKQAIRFINTNTIRIERLEEPGQMPVIFVRKKH
jgi:hypothetical protein